MKNSKEKYWKTLAVFNFVLNIALVFGLVVMLNLVIGLNKTVYALENPVIPTIRISQEVSPEEKTEPIVDKTEITSLMDKPSTQEVLPVAEEAKSTSSMDKPILQHEVINNYVNQITTMYPNVDAALVKSVIQHESQYNPNHITGNCVGLMQISTYWHADRAAKLHVTDFMDPYSNILLGVDYLSELIAQYKDPALALMMYNMDNSKALKLYKEGKISGYAESVLVLADEYRKGE